MPSDNYMLFKKSDRSKDGYYTIPGGVNHVFNFLIFPSRHSNITMSMVELVPPTQQGSLHVWLSRRPLDKVLFETNTAMNPMMLTFTTKTISLWDVNLENLTPGVLTLDPMLTYYLNVRNMQSSQNAYKLLLPR